MLAALLVALALGGCSFAPVSLPFAWPPWKRAEPTPALQPLSILLGSGTSQSNAALLTSLEQFGALHGGVTYTVTFAADYDQALQKAVAANALPDIFVVPGHRMPELAQQGLLAPVPAEHHYLIADLYPSLRPALTHQGTLYCLPRSATSLALVYNVDLFDAKAVAHPSAAWTWSDLRAAAEQLTNPNDDLYGLVLEADLSRFLAFFRQAGGDAPPPLSLSDLSGEPALAAVEFLVAMYAEGIAAESVAAGSVWPGEALARGSAAMVIEGGWILPYLEQNFPEVDFGVAPLPRGPVRGGSTAFVSCYAVRAGSPRLADAFATAASLAQPDAVAAVAAPDGYAPPYRGLGGTWIGQYPRQSPFVLGLDDSLLWLPDAESSTALASANAALRDAFSGDLDIAGVLDSWSAAPQLANPGETP